MSLSIVNGHAEFSFKLGKRLTPTIISSKVINIINVVIVSFYNVRLFYVIFD